MADTHRDFATGAQATRTASASSSVDHAREQSPGGHLRPAASPVLAGNERFPSALSIDDARNRAHSSGVFSPASVTSFRSPFGRRSSSNSSGSARFKNRPRRSSTIRTYESPRQPNWEPGAEPGIDTTAQDSADDYHKPHAQCDITVIDFCEEQVEQTEQTNASLAEFLDEPRPDWVDCRWICVNGIDWGVIKLLGNYKKLHRLAIEDLMATRSRPKVDWYSDHAFIVLSLQKLVRIMDESIKQPDELDDHDGHETKPKQSMWKRMFRRQQPLPDHKASVTSGPTIEKLDELDLDDVDDDEIATTHAQEAVRPVRTLQRWRGGPNMERIEFMESKSALTKRNLAVSVEQVCIFLTDDNTVISFFENSSADVLEPIGSRLGSEATILRRTADASLLVQAIIDAIIDLAMPVAAAYEDAIGNLELEVLTDPSMRQPRELYILTSEINLLRNTITPITNLIHSLREHRGSNAAAPGNMTGGRPTMNRLVTSSSVAITPLTLTYLSDVEDHLIMLSSSLDRMRVGTEHLTMLIFNTISAHQNESVKQLTLVNILFLVRLNSCTLRICLLLNLYLPPPAPYFPCRYALHLLFLAELWRADQPTGFFGMNFHIFWAVQNFTDSFFWWVAAPVIVVTGLFMMRNYVVRSVETFINKSWIRRSKKKRMSRERTRHALERKRRRAQTLPQINEGSVAAV